MHIINDFLGKCLSFDLEKLAKWWIGVNATTDRDLAVSWFLLVRTSKGNIYLVVFVFMGLKLR